MIIPSIIVVDFILLLALSWGLSNRGRGWGPLVGAPKWQFTVANLLNRDTMAAWHGISVVLACLAFGVPLWWQGTALAACTAIFWRLAVTRGWGEYQDGRDNTNDEIKWIDDLAMNIAARLPVRFLRPHWIDGISMALRGVYYVPIYIAAGLIMDSWWFALPAAFFWQAGAVYATLWRKGPNQDPTLWAEWIDDTIRGLLFFTAFAGSAGLVG